MTKLSSGAARLFHQRLGRRHEASVSTLKEGARVVRAVVAALRAAGFSKDDVFAVRLTLDEALVNAVKHGHHGDPTKRARVRWQIRGEGVLLVVRDQGPGFNPRRVPDPCAGQGLGRDSGRGLLLMRTYMTRVHHNRRGNAVLLYRKHSPA
jgi:serine/threonine-protein kinase RsbW